CCPFLCAINSGPACQWPVSSRCRNSTKSVIRSRSSPTPDDPWPLRHVYSRAILLFFVSLRCLFRRRFLRVRMGDVLLSGLPRSRRAVHFVAALVFAALVRLPHLLLFFH